MRYLLIIIFSVSCCIALAQHRGKPAPFKPLTPKDNLQIEIGSECYFSNKYTKIERLHMYPFNKAKSVVLISYKENEGLPVQNRRVNNNKIIEKVTLRPSQIDNLTKTLYNVIYTPIKARVRTLGGYSCYEPRNGILFLDAQGKVFEDIAICFACEHTRTSSGRINEGDYCSTKYELLRNFFITSGIKYGTAERHPIRSYSEIFKLDTIDITDAIKNKLAVKTKNSTDLSDLNETEHTLLFAINAEELHHGSYNRTGLAGFYITHSGDYYQETLNSLKIINAKLTFNVLQASKKEWPGGNIPHSFVKRRTELLKIINKAHPHWQKLEEELFNFKNEDGVRYSENKEDLNRLIFTYATLHRNELQDKETQSSK